MRLSLVRDPKPLLQLRTDNAMRRLIEEAAPEEKARLHRLSEDERRKLAKLYYEQNRDREPSPLEDDPPACKSQKVVRHKQL